jgi:glycosyltransferase involved in cell wall biosynthesis
VRGIGRYVAALLPRIATARRELSIILFATDSRDAATLGARTAAEPALTGRVEVRLLRELPRTTADVFWYPWNAIITKPRAGAIVVTVHDVAPIALADPRWTRWLKNRRARRRYEEVARLATRVPTISEFSAREAERWLGIGRDRLRVTRIGGDFGTPSDPARDAEALQRLGITKPFLLTVGAADRRKNFGMLQRAMPRVRAAHPDLTLVLAGPRRKGSAQDPLQSWEHAAGFVSDDDLWSLYRSAELFVFPSRYEGFGLPVIEAMRVGAAVVCTNSSSLPEVGGDAVAYVPSDDADALASTITAILDDRARQHAMRAASRAHWERCMTWDDTARATLAVLDEAALAVAAPVLGATGR